MARILGLHIRDSKNIGDRNCHPLDYIKFSEDQISADVRNPPLDYDPDIVILGGGAIAYTAPEIRKQFPKALLISWGIGHSERKLQPVSYDHHLRLGEGFALWGSRDFAPGLEYVPCASCLHPFFDNIPKPKYPAIVFGHAGVNPLKDDAEALGIPYFNNTNSGGIEAALDHIASGSTVISSSYHGALWAVLMGRKVCMIPFGTKFFSQKFRPPHAQSVSHGIAEANSFDDALTDSRKMSKRFEERVAKLIAKIG